MGKTSMAQLGDGTYNQYRPARADCGQQCHGDCRRESSQPVSQERRQPVGHGLEQLHGQLGDGTYNNTNRPEQIVASNVTAIAAGNIHSLFLKSNGSLWAMGDNTYGQLGDGTLQQHQPARADRGQQCHGDCRRIPHSLFLKKRWQSVGHGLERCWPVG